jgi:hypothetical protein
MRRNKLLLSMLIVGASTLAVAATPEGSGSVSLGLGLVPGGQREAGMNSVSYNDYGASIGWRESLQADAPIWSGLTAALRADLGQDSAQIQSGATHVNDGFQTYGLGLQLRAYPAAFARRPFNPGADANPDGWLLWPSVSLRYGAIKTGEFSDIENGGHGMVNIYTADQTLGYGLILPLATWLSLEGTYDRVIQEDRALSISPATFQYGGDWEAESVDATVYLDLAPGAGADTGRAFVPHLGRLGQLKLNLGWAHRWDRNQIPLSVQFPSYTDTYTLGAALPVTADLGLGLAFSDLYQDQFPGTWGPNVGHLSTDNRHSQQIALSASWAFGSAESRVDR